MTGFGSLNKLVWYRTLAFKVAVAACTVLATTTILLNTAAFFLGRNIVRNEVHKRLHTVATDRQQMIFAYSTQQQERVGLVASRTQLRAALQQYLDGSIDVHALREQTQPILDDAVQSADGFVDIWICAPNGRVITATYDRLLEADYSDDRTFETGKRQKYFGDLALLDNKYHAHLAAPAMTDDGRLMGVVMVLVDASPLVNILQKSDGLGESGGILIATQEGDHARLLVPRRGQESTSIALSSAPVLAAALRGETSAGAVQTVIENVDVLAEYCPIRFQEKGNRQWGLVAHMDVAEAYQPITTLALTLSLIGVGTLLVALVASIVLATKATRPLRTLTEQDERQKELEKLSLVASKTQHSVVISDAQGRIEWVNDAFTKLTGYTKDEVMGRRPGDQMQGPDTDPETVAQIGKKLRRHESVAAEILNYGKLGNKYWIDLKIDPVFNHQGELTNFIATQIDITERRQHEMSLRAAKQAAEEASVAKSQFLASMSHELRTPLNGVIGMTELLAGTELNERQRKFVEACRYSGESLLQLINDILDFSKIEAGKLELDLHDFDLEKLVTDTVETMAWRATDKNLEMLSFVDQSSRLVLKGDSNRLRQVLVNLLGNAVKFTQAGEVLVRTKIVARQEDRITVRFSVSDTGIGIPSDKLDRLFRSFSQVDASTTRNYGGTGLGLAISQSLVKLMGGTIGVESKEGAGSTFWFEVPFELVSESFDALPETSPLAGRRALIVDDHETNRVILAEYIAGWGLAAVTTSSVDEALVAVDRAEEDGTPFHLVLTDYNMPKRNGLELARALIDHPQLIVLLLGSTDIQLNARELQEHGIHATLRKPLRRYELHDVLCGLLCQVKEPTEIENELTAIRDTTLPTGYVLLAEDNSINQMYIVELMKQLGCTCDTVSTGRETLDAVLQRKYDLVLMDCQMPEMDGFEATRLIRQREADGTLDGHLPIIALTANAIKGDRERCLDAGMDEYLSKPVQKQQIVSVLQRFFSDIPESSLEIEATVATPHGVSETFKPAPIDANAFLERCMGSLEFAGSLLDELESTGKERVEEIRKQAERRDAAATADAAHSLKGAAGILCAASLQQLSADIEQAGRSSAIHDIQRHIDELATEMQRCLNYMPQLRLKLNSVKEDV